MGFGLEDEVVLGCEYDDVGQLYIKQWMGCVDDFVWFQGIECLFG